MNVSDKLEQRIRQLLRVPNTWSEPEADGSVMWFGQYCRHDDGFMCQCRLDRLIQIIREFEDVE